jgi:hypothetical protein
MTHLKKQFIKKYHFMMKLHNQVASYPIRIFAKMLIRFYFQIKAVDICEGRGFLSHIIRTTIQFVDAKQPSFSFVIKVPQSDTYDSIPILESSFSGSAGSLAEVCFSFLKFESKSIMSEKSAV